MWQCSLIVDTLSSYVMCCPCTTLSEPHFSQHDPILNCIVWRICKPINRIKTIILCSKVVATDVSWCGICQPNSIKQSFYLIQQDNCFTFWCLIPHFSSHWLSGGRTSWWQHRRSCRIPRRQNRLLSHASRGTYINICVGICVCVLIRVCVCASAHACECVYFFVCGCVYTRCEYVATPTHTHIHTHTNTDLHVVWCLIMDRQVCMYVYICLCIYIHVYIHTYKHTLYLALSGAHVLSFSGAFSLAVALTLDVPSDHTPSTLLWKQSSNLKRNKYYRVLFLRVEEKRCTIILDVEECLVTFVICFPAIRWSPQQLRWWVYSLQTRKKRNPFYGFFFLKNVIYLEPVVIWRLRLVTQYPAGTETYIYMSISINL